MGQDSPLVYLHQKQAERNGRKLDLRHKQGTQLIVNVHREGTPEAKIVK